MAQSLADLGYWSDQGLEEDAVQPPNRSRIAAPPEDSAAGHSFHAGEEWRILLDITPLITHPLYRASDPHVCSILHIFLYEEFKLRWTCFIEQYRVTS
jgi:hypothetical protein